MRIGRVALSCTVASCLVVGMQTSGGGAVRSTKAPHGYHVVKVKTAGFSVAVPDTWATIDANHVSKRQRKDWKKLRDANPALGLPRDPTAMLQGNGAFMAGDFANDAKGLLVVLIKGRFPPPTPADIATLLSGSENLQVEAGSVNGIDAVIATFVASLNLPDGSTLHTSHVQYYVVNSRGVLQFDFNNGDAPAEVDIREAIMESLTLES